MLIQFRLTILIDLLVFTTLSVMDHRQCHHEVRQTLVAQVHSLYHLMAMMVSRHLPERGQARLAFQQRHCLRPGRHRQSPAPGYRSRGHKYEEQLQRHFSCRHLLQQDSLNVLTSLEALDWQPKRPDCQQEVTAPLDSSGEVAVPLDVETSSLAAADVVGSSSNQVSSCSTFDFSVARIVRKHLCSV